VGKPDGKRPLGRPRQRRVDNIRMDLGEVRWGNVDWIGLAQESTTGGLSRSAQLRRVSYIFQPYFSENLEVAYKTTTIFRPNQH
jgi:hypothetical protein